MKDVFGFYLDNVPHTTEAPPIEKEDYLVRWKNRQYGIYQRRKDLPHFLFVVITTEHIKKAWQLSKSSESYDEYRLHYFDPLDVALFQLLGNFSLSFNRDLDNFPKKVEIFIESYDNCSSLKEAKKLKGLSFVHKITLDTFDKRDFDEYFKTI